MVSSCLDLLKPSNLIHTDSSAMTRAVSLAVRRSEPVLVGPARPTPRETKLLSDIDNTESPQSYMTVIYVYRAAGVSSERGDPVAVLRRALSEALVHYYPLAGRLREVLNGGGLMVDCTGEGVIFVEAEADFRLAELQAASRLVLPFPFSMDEVQLNMDCVTSALDYTMVLMQVTRLVCGGIIIGVRLCHSICDGHGFVQFLSAISDLARGHPSPAIAPAWSRELLTMGKVSDSTFPHRDRVRVPASAPFAAAKPFAPNDMMTRSFIFGPADIAALRRNLSRSGSGATVYEVLAASVWRARTAAIAVSPGEDTVLIAVADFRRNHALHLPPGYYGNACGPLRVAASADVLTRGSLDDAVELVRKAKAAATNVRSVNDLVLLHGTVTLSSSSIFLLSDHRHLGLGAVDFGWGEPLYGGVAEVMFRSTGLLTVKNSHGEEEVVLPMALPRTAMENFVTEMNKLLDSGDQHRGRPRSSL